MSYREELLEQMVRGNRLDWWKNYADFYLIGKDKVAKVFHNSDDARMEYKNLFLLSSLDERINVPEPYEMINLGTGYDLESQGISPPRFCFYNYVAVVMELLKGRCFKDLTKREKAGYEEPLVGMVNAFIEHHLWRWDFKAEDLLAFDDGSLYMVDTHTIRKMYPRHFEEQSREKINSFLER